MAKCWFVYMIKTHKNTLYTGVTTDVERRFREHASQGVKSARYLRGKAPLELVWVASVDDKQMAMRLEYRIKQLPRKTKDKLVANEHTLESLFVDVFETSSSSV
ncbi:GIY-YIG nuclease family protein [Marinomonas piezotolerans]|uniref:GIY-YIG nuclease family protein n=1 Tax=Marinomonas piezotolerans TaxID=2213058 RepID=A0A370U8B5_9GAMM|nr:GIY-YIG nuclease family protein [Marinomonas piezotolerans]RDL43968.1 GIY-YIG nuclease family protein [Marinomonas piezotolerans]